MYKVKIFDWHGGLKEKLTKIGYSHLQIVEMSSEDIMKFTSQFRWTAMKHTNDAEYQILLGVSDFSLGQR